MNRSLSRSNPGYQDEYQDNSNDDDDAGNSLESECIIEDESETTSAEDPCPMMKMKIFLNLNWMLKIVTLMRAVTMTNMEKT